MMLLIKYLVERGTAILLRKNTNFFPLLSIKMYTQRWQKSFPIHVYLNVFQLNVMIKIGNIRGL